MEEKIGKLSLVAKKIPRGVPKPKVHIFLDLAKIQKHRFLRNIQKTLVLREITPLREKDKKTETENRNKIR